MKTCSKCGETKARELFSRAARGADGLRSYCKACAAEYSAANASKIAEYNRRYREANAAKLAEQQRRWYEENREKRAERMRAWREANAEKEAERKRLYRENNAEKIAAYRKANVSKTAEYNRRYHEENAEKVAEKDRAWRQANPHLVNAQTARRRVAKLQRTPAWADQVAIATWYEIATLASKVFGEPYAVDHVVPLRGRTATGLHVAANLRVIPAVENGRKHNKLDHAVATDKAAGARALVDILRRAKPLLPPGSIAKIIQEVSA